MLWACHCAYLGPSPLLLDPSKTPIIALFRKYIHAAQDRTKEGVIGRTGNALFLINEPIKRREGASRVTLDQHQQLLDSHWRSRVVEGPASASTLLSLLVGQVINGVGYGAIARVTA